MSTDTQTAVAQPLPAQPSTLAQRRLEAFCAAGGPEVFHSVVRPDQIWHADPLDVATIHQQARETFERLVVRATMPEEYPSGRILLLKGESGSGKTHLMRAFRQAVHGNERGYCGYLQMTAQASNYSRYILIKLIDALDQPYCAPDVPTSGLARLSLGLLEMIPGMTPQERERFQDGDVSNLSQTVEQYADRILADPRFHSSDLDLIRALLYLQRNDARIKLRVLKWLRCEDMSAADRALLGDLVPRTHDEWPQQMIAHLGQLMGTLHGMPLILCVDQLEDMTEQEAAPEQFRRVMNALVAIAEEIPSAVLVIACLEDYYASHRQYLMKPKLDRIESDPEPIRLTGNRSLEEVEAIVARRLHVLYDEMGVAGGEEAGTFPFTPAHLQPLVNLRTRDVLDFCRRHREACMRANTWVEPEGHLPGTVAGQAKPSADGEQLTSLEQAWNDFRVAFKDSVPDEEAGLAGLLAWAVKQCSEEVPMGYFFHAEADGRMVPVEMHGPNNAVDRLFLAVCDRASQGGGLGKQIKEVENRAGEIPLVILRSTAFPSSPTAAVSKQIAALLKKGGRRVVVENADWRTMLAFRQFHDQHRQQPAYADWLRKSQPLCQLASLRQALELDGLLKQAPATSQVTNISPAIKTAAQANSAAGQAVAIVQPEGPTRPLLLGTRTGLTEGPVTVEPRELTQHAAFLGGSGSGKTTVALTLIEQLLERGVPAVLVDRKGDLCRYADPSAWRIPLADAAQAARRDRLRTRLDVHVFTPGNPGGRSLTIPVVPEGMDQLTTFDREQLAGYAAAALGGMLGYKPKGNDQKCQAILRKAIEVLGSAAKAEVSLLSLQQLIEQQDEALLHAVGGFDGKLYKKVADDLLTLRLNHQQLLASTGERLDIGALLGRDTQLPAGKTRLSIISTRFLPDQATVDFWVSQFLVAIGRWMGKHATAHLQAIFLFDEADQYLPALRQPATKAPMENLLKRARSAGIGLFLATQSPGDFDYKCRDTIRTWLVGRVKEQTALNKLKPMLAESKIDAAAKLPNQGTGQFYLLREKEVCSLRTQLSLVATEQLPEEKILALARASRGLSGAQAGQAVAHGSVP